MARQTASDKQRTLIVLGTLLAAMTLGAGLLLIEPPAMAPGDSVRLMSTDAERVEPTAALFNTSPELNWSAIVIYDSGSQEGSAQTIDKVHQQLGLGGLGYHFVIDNGLTAPDGRIEIGQRWARQLAGAHSRGPNAAWFNSHAIGICLIGDMDRESPTESQVQRLTWLVQQLQAKFHISADRIYLQTGSGSNGSRSLFPSVSFRQQLLMQQ